MVFCLCMAMRWSSWLCNGGEWWRLNISKGGMNGWCPCYSDMVESWFLMQCSKVCMVLAVMGFHFKCVAMRWIRLWIRLGDVGLLLWELVTLRFQQLFWMFSPPQWCSAVFRADETDVWSDKWNLWEILQWGCQNFVFMKRSHVCSCLAGFHLSTIWVWTWFAIEGLLLNAFKLFGSQDRKSMSWGARHQNSSQDILFGVLVKRKLSVLWTCVFTSKDLTCLDSLGLTAFAWFWKVLAGSFCV